MKKLPVQWYININEDIDNKLMKKFKNWISQKFMQDVGFEPEFNSYNYGFDGELHRCTSLGEKITLEYWHDCVFGVKEQFEQGEEVLVKDKNHDEWVSVLFVCEYNGLYVADCEGDVDCWDECKKKPSKLDLKIEELKKLAQENGVKLTIICE